MASNYPASIDSLPLPAASDELDSLTKPHAAGTVGIIEAILAVQTILGTNPQGPETTVKARILAAEGRLDAVEANDWVTTARIADDAVTADQIADNAVGAAQIASGAVGTAELANDSVTADKIAADAVGTSEIAAGAVGTLELATGAVTPAKLALAYAAKTSTYTATVDDTFLHFTSGASTLNLPAAAGCTGREFVVVTSGSATVTLDPNGAELIGGAATLALAGAGMVRIVSTGTAWIVLAGQYVSTAAGRAVYTWDAAASGWQLVHGDTGWRAITPLAIANCNEWFNMRRVNHTVHGVAEIQITSGTTLAITDFYSLPSGFQGNAAFEEVWRGGRIGSLGTDQSLSISRDTGSQMLRATAAMSGATVICSFTFATTDAWPASLPGS